MLSSDTCTKHPVFKDLIAGCNGGYSFSNEDNEQYSAGWNKPLNKSARWKLRKNKRKSLYLGLETPWQYQSVLKLKNFPFIGLYNTYGGSSYAVSIGPDLRQSNVIVKNMKDNFWIDKQTRAIFTEINIYNANTNLLLIVTFVNEILPTGGWGYFENIQALRLFRWTGGLGTVILLFDFIFIGVTLVGIYKLVKACKKEGTKAYLKNPWNLLHALVTGFSVCTIACIFARLAARMWAMSQYAKDPEVFVSFGYVGQMDYFLSAFIGFVVMSTNLEFLRLLRFNRRIGLLTTTMKQSAKPLASFGLMFVFLFIAYVSLAHFVYVDKLADFKSFASTFVALVKMFLGQFSVHDYINNAPVIGPFMFFSYMVIVQMILINMFIGIVCETFEDVRNDLEKQSNEHEIMAFMTNKFKKFAGAAVGPDTDAIYRDWKPKWQQTLDDIEDRADNVIYIMRNMEADEVRQNKWFDPDKADEKKKNMLKMLVGSDDFVYENDILGGLQAIDKKMKRVTVEQTYDMVVKVAKQRKKEKDDEKQGHPDGNESTFSTDDELSDSDESDSDN